MAIKKNESLPRTSAVLNILLYGSIFLIWILVLIRSGEYLQEGYYYFNGMMFTAMYLCLVFPIMVIVYRHWEFSSLRLISFLLQIIGAVLGFLLAYQYQTLQSIIHEPPYILIGIFFQNNLSLISAQITVMISLLILNFLILLTPQHPTDFPNQYTGGVGSDISNSMLSRKLTIIAFGGFFIFAAVMVNYIYTAGLLHFLYMGYGGTLFAGILTWWVSRGIYAPPENSSPLDVDLLISRNGLKGYYAAAVLIIINSLIGLFGIGEMPVLLFLGRLLLNFVLLAFGRLIWDKSMKPGRRSQLKALMKYKQMKSASNYFGFYNVYGGLAILAASILYFFDVNRHMELLAAARLMLMIAIFFGVGHFLMEWISPKVFQIIIWLALLSTLQLQLNLISAAITTNWGQFDANKIDGFEYLQSWRHAFLCGLAIGLVFATCFENYRDYFKHFQGHGIHFETQFTFLFVFLISGLVFGHDYHFSGLHLAEYQENAQLLYDFFLILNYIFLIITILTICFVLFEFARDHSFTTRINLENSILDKHSKILATEGDL